MILNRTIIGVLFPSILIPTITLAQQTLTYPPAPVPVDKVAATMTVPDGFKVTLFAGEPDVVQPIAFTFDDRGRMWVAECLSYPKWTKDGAGRDRIVIFEDTDGDGRHDKRKVFAENLANLSSLEFGFGGVFICSLPTLKFIPDRDGDDVPDGPAETLLDGWDENCRHNVFNGLAWGPDGWLYGLNGILSRSLVGPPGAAAEKRKYLDCGVWRYHPTRRDFEPVASGTTNPWGLDWDEYGEMFITNCVIKHLFHVVPGGHYERMFGADPNPHVYGLMPSCADHIHWAGGHWTDSRGALGAHSDAGGGHAHSGCSVYLGDNFPPEYRNNVFMCNIHGNRLNRDSLERHGSGYVAHHEKDFLFANDPWHRGLVVKYGPDGALYVADWCDTGECHNYEVADVTNGRIVRVKYEGSGERGQGSEKRAGSVSDRRSSSRQKDGANDGSEDPVPNRYAFDLQKLSDKELFVLQSHPNEWFVRHARRILQERAAARKLGPEIRTLLAMMFSEDPEPSQRLRGLWGLHAIGAADELEISRAFSDKNEHVAAWGIALAGELPWSDQIRSLLFHAAADRRMLVCMRVASIVPRVPRERAAGLVSYLMRTAEYSSDDAISLMNWYAIEQTFSTKDLNDETWKHIRSLTQSGTSLTRRLLARHLLLTAATPAESSRRIGELLGSSGIVSPDASERNRVSALRALPDLCAGVLEALRGTRDLPAPKRWNDLYPILTRIDSPEVHKATEKLAVVFGDVHVIDKLEETLVDKAQPVDARREALDLLVEKRLKSLPRSLVPLVDDPALRSDAIRALAAYDDEAAAERLVSRFGSFNDAEKADALQTLAARSSYALALLDAVEEGTIDRREVPSGVAQQIAALKNKEIAERLAKIWGSVRPTSAARKEQAARLKQILTSPAMAKADAARGRALFTKSCAACHKLFGEGGAIGPELTGSQRANVDYVLENVLDPSAKVGRLYQVTILELADGRVVQGVIAEENDLALTVQTPNARLTIAKSDVESRQQTPLSLMPEGLFDQLDDAALCDLMAYLAK
jgi:putative membrane-bound dehydrogenase-like protein